MMALGRAASIRWASDLAANPPNTAEWIAPRRVMARAAISAAGIIGTKTVSNALMNTAKQGYHTVDNHNIALLNPLLPQHPGQHLHLIQQLLVGVLLLRARHRRLPDNCSRIPVPVVHMPIDAVVGRGDFAVGEPGPVLVGISARKRLGPLGHGAGRFLVPVELLGVMQPKTLWVAQGELLHHSLGMLHGVLYRR